MRLDTHVHTSPGSRCSVMSVHEYVRTLAELKIAVACVTNHGNMADFDRLAGMALGPLKLIPGVEISAAEGDFLIFSGDFDYLRGLEPLQILPERSERPEGTALVWAHPFAGTYGGRGMGEDYLEAVAPRVDGIEVYNGNWPDEEASRKARDLAARFGLAEMGGSDAHSAGNLLRCWTEVPELASAEELVQAILSRQTRAVRAAKGTCSN